MTEIGMSRSDEEDERGEEELNLVQIELQAVQHSPAQPQNKQS